MPPRPHRPGSLHAPARPRPTWTAYRAGACCVLALAGWASSARLAEAQVPEAPSVAASRAESAAPARRRTGPTASPAANTAHAPAVAASQSSPGPASPPAEPQGWILFAALLASIGYVTLRRIDA